MTHPNRVATLIANPSAPCLTTSLADAARDAVDATAVYFLADGIACDIPLPPESDQPLEKLRLSIGSQAVDCVVQDSDTRRKKVLLADMDSTMIQQECIDELAAKAGIGEQIANITARAMRGELEFESALRERVSLLEGKPITLIDAVLKSRITLMPGGKELVATMKSNGAYCALVSGGFVQFTSVVAEKLGFDENRANTFEIEHGCFTGNVIPPILGKEAKVEALESICAAHELDESDVMAVGDGANDIGMLARAGSGVAIHAKPAVAEHAKIRIDHGDLTALLYLQGYRKADFAG